MSPLSFISIPPAWSTPSAGRRHGRTLLLVLVLVLSMTPARGDQTPDPDRTRLAGEIISLIRAGDRAEALPLCRSFNERYPDDMVMLYNQACLENTAGRPDAAAEALARAVAAGFEDFAMAFADPDLAGLENHPALAPLIEDQREGLSQLAEARAVALNWQEASEPIILPSSAAGPRPDDPEIILTWTPVGLSLELRAAGPWSTLTDPGQPAPWNGGAGLVITLGLPPSGDGSGFETGNHFIFAFGTENNGPIGGLYLSAVGRWQAVAELQPKIKLDEGGDLAVRATIPWTAILPYNPLVDDHLGFNASLRAGRQVAALLPDPADFRPRSPVRRVVPLTFNLESVEGEILAGKVSNTISGSEPVIMELVVHTTEPGTGRLAIDFLAGPDQSLLPDGQVFGPVELTGGTNRVTRELELSGLVTGAYLIKVELDFPSGESRTWAETLLHLAPGWREEYQGRINRLIPGDMPTARYHFATIEAAIAGHLPRSSPGPIVTALHQLGSMLDSAEKSGSILPDQGPFLAVYPGPGGEERLCRLYLPAGWRIAKRLNPVLTLAGSPDLAAAIVDRIGKNYDQGRQIPTLKAGKDEGYPLYLAPRLDTLGPDETAACLAWAKTTFGVTQVSLAGVDAGAGPALLAAADEPESVKAMIIFAGEELEPWPQADIDFIREQLAGFPGNVPVTWTDFVTETRHAGQGPLILEALKDLKGNIVEVVEVPGGLNFTQAADRTVQWAEGLR